MKLNRESELCASIARGLIAEKKAKASLPDKKKGIKEREERKKKKKKIQRKSMEKVFAFTPPKRVSSVTIALADSNCIVYFPLTPTHSFFAHGNNEIEIQL